MSAAPAARVAAVWLVAKPVQKRGFETSVGCTASKNRAVFPNTSRQEIIAGPVFVQGLEALQCTGGPSVTVCGCSLFLGGCGELVLGFLFCEV